MVDFFSYRHIVFLCRKIKERNFLADCVIKYTIVRYKNSQAELFSL